MARIKCKNCGKVYRYETEGCCPECGAYNRPPRHGRVNADGTIYHIEDADYLEKRHAKPRGGKVCFEEKECHEEKVCYEEQGYYRTQEYYEEDPVAAASDVSAPVQNPYRQHRQKTAKGAVVFIVAFLVVVMVIFVTAFQSCRYEVSYVDEGIDPTLVEYTVLDGTATAYMQDAYNVENGTLWYVDTEGYLCSADSENIVCNDGLCTMEFSVGEDYQMADSIEIYCEDDWIHMMVDPTATVEWE